MIDRFLGVAFGILSSPFWSTILQRFGVLFCGSSAAVTHFKLLDRAVSGARFITGGAFESDTAHRRSVAVLCML